MIVSNRKLFKKRPARDSLNNAAGIMASSPELMNEVQSFQDGGNVQLPGSVGSIVQMLDAVKDFELPEMVISGRRGPNEVARQKSVRNESVVVANVPVRLPSGEMGYAVYDNGQLKGYQSEPPGGSMIERKGNPNVQTVNRRDIDPEFAYDRGVAERIEAMDKSTDFRKDAAGAAEGIAGLLKTPITTIQDMASAVSNYFTGPTADVKKDIDSPFTPYPTGVDIGTIADDVGSRPELTPGQITTVRDPEGFREQEELLSLGSDFYSDPEEIQRMIDGIRVGETEQALKEKRIQEGKEATERMKGPVPPTTDLGTRVEKIKAERDAIETKEQKDFERAILAGQTADVKGFTDPTSLNEILDRKQVTNEIGGMDPRVDMPPGAFPKGTKEQLGVEKEDEQDTKTFDAMGNVDIDPKAKENFNNVDQVVQQTTGTDIKALMNEFMSQAPEYEGMNKGMAIAKIGFAMAAGQSPNGLTNIANALSMGADMFLKDDKEKQAFNRQLQLSALQYGLGEVSKERAQARSDARSFQQFVDKDGNPVLVPLSEIMKSGGLLPEGLQYKDLYLTNVAAADERLKAILEAEEKRIDDLVMDPTAQRKELEIYESAVIDFQQSTNMVELTNKLILQVNDEGNKITTLGAGFKDLANKAFQAAGIKTSKSYKNLADFQADLKIAFQALIPLKLGKTQSANSISDRDVDLLAQAYFGAAVLQGGSFSLVGLDSNILTKKLQTVLGTFKGNVKSSLGKMKNSEKFLGEYLLADRKTPVSTRLTDFTPEGVKDITDYNPNISYDEKTNTYIVRVGES